MIDVLSLTERSWADVKDFMTQQKSFIFFLKSKLCKACKQFDVFKKKKLEDFLTLS